MDVIFRLNRSCRNWICKNQNLKNPIKSSSLQNFLQKKRRTFFDSFAESDWIELCLKNSSFLYHPESFLLDDETRQAILLMEYFKKKNIRIGLSTAANLCKRNKESYSIDAFNIETALPIRNLVITNAEIEEALTSPHYQPCKF